MTRRVLFCCALLVTVPLLARPALAAGAAPTRSAEPQIARLLSESE